jgi:cadmium resistance protein CadD (predicted permease)
MGLPKRLGIFFAPIGLATICKATLASANGGADFAVYQAEPAKLVDLSIDLLLTAAAVLFGVMLYVNSKVTTKPGTDETIEVHDVVVCAFVQIVALILIFGSTIGLPHIPYVKDNYQSLVTIWAPDLLGLFAFVWVIVKLT